MIVPFDGKTPSVDASAYVAPGAVVIGRVHLGPRSSVWPAAVLRGDIESISVGGESNIQDGCVVHTDHRIPCRIGKRVTVGHRAVLHSCRVGDGSLIGMGSTVLSGASIGKSVLIGAASLVLEGQIIPSGVLALGSPAKVVRPLKPPELKHLEFAAAEYVRLLGKYARSAVLYADAELEWMADLARVFKSG